MLVDTITATFILARKFSFVNVACFKLRYVHCVFVCVYLQGTGESSSARQEEASLSFSSEEITMR
jgi:hypothetical protein